MHGALLVDKPSGPTSHDIVGFVRRILKTSRVGHTGTLDPLATGLLLLLVGHATRLSQFLVTDEKEYIADVRLGIATPTYDAASLGAEVGGWGVEVGSSKSTRPSRTEIEEALDAFRGTFLQTPPPFSAKKVEGTRAYEKARKNQPVQLQPVAVTVRELEVLGSNSSEPTGFQPTSSPQPPTSSLLRLRVAASAGFYVRSLAHDIGQRLGCGAHLEALRRTRVGRFRVDEAVTLEALQDPGTSSGHLIPMNTLLDEIPAVSLTDEGIHRAGHGNSLTPRHLVGPAPVSPAGANTRMRLLDGDGSLLAVAEWRPDGLLHPVLVLR